MDRIKLSKGLIAIGGCKETGKSRFALKLANHIAKNENVLYISYKDYGEKLRAIIEEMDGHVSENLQLDSSFSYFGSVVFLQIIKQVKEKKYSTVFLDDLDNFSGVETNEYYSDEKHEIIGSMKFLSEFLDIKFVFITNTSQPNYDDNFYPPRIKDFRWCRRIINDSTQIFGLFRPYTNGLTEDEEGNSLIDKIEIHHLKNENNREEIIFLDNKEIKIYNNQL